MCYSVLQYVAAHCSVMYYLLLLRAEAAQTLRSLRCTQTCVQRVAACCSVLQRVAVCCSVLQCVAACWKIDIVFSLLHSVLYRVCCSVFECVQVCCSELQYVAVCWNRDSVLSLVHLVVWMCGADLLIWQHDSEHTATHCDALQHTATNCNSLRCTAIRCLVLQHIAAHCVRVASTN